MKITNAQITLDVGGVEMTFSQEELAAILKEHFSGATTEQEVAKPILRPMEGVPFVVDPSGIDRSLFQKKRKDRRQEETRQHILEAFAKMDENPGKYDKPFKTLMPAKTWDWKTVDDLKKLAANLGDHNANWVEQFLEWAQRIQNGETWEAICNKADTANWYRLIEWKNGYARVVGGSRLNYNNYPASAVNICNFYSDIIFDITVPLVVLYK